MNPTKLLIDENLSPLVATTLCEDGVDTAHVRDRGLNGASDPEVLEHAFAEDRVLATVNVDDFVKLARTRELHAGIVLIEQGGLRRDEQVALMRRVVELLAGEDMANRVLWVAHDGSMEIEELPPP